MEEDIRKETLRRVARELAVAGQKQNAPLSEEQIIALLEQKLMTVIPEVTEVRPQVLECDVVRFQNNKEKWVALVGLLDGYPYEIFTGLQDDEEGIMLPKTVDFIGTAIPAVATVGTIEPNLEHVAIFRQQLAQLVTEVSDVFRPAVLRMVPVPRREIDGIFQSLLLAGLSQFAHHVALTVLPRRVLHGILCIFRGPHAEAAMMLSSEDDALHACLFADTCPLTTIKVAGVE